MTTGYEVSFYRDMERLATDVHELAAIAGQEVSIRAEQAEAIVALARAAEQTAFYSKAWFQIEALTALAHYPSTTEHREMVSEVIATVQEEAKEKFG